MLVTFGVVPTSPHTGYGYLRRGAGAARLRRRLHGGGVQGEAGPGDGGGVPGLGRLLVELRHVRLAGPHPAGPDSRRSSRTTFALVNELAAAPERLTEIYPQLLKISVDYAVMEPVSQGQGTASVVAVRLPITWHDVGGFASLGEHLPRDEAGNALQGASVLVDARDNLVINNAEDGRLVAVVGLSDTVIVQTPQITLVCPVSEAERIKELVAEVTARLGRSYA